ncbi:phytanoyl-CoA dioxygenase family protein [Roseovarius aquimarinus]|uniref:Phytanoyl-CoA dioxygenase (PhyH) n=1 Tax=Roseovarius aquimarinus TaxID=1229156 RepID=A0ABW7I696_9RHOB
MVSEARSSLATKGWARFEVDAGLARWAEAAKAAALARMAEPAHRAEWLQCEGTWFVGVDTLPNDARGAVQGSGPLTGPGYDLARALYGELPLHAGQVSVTWPGYPRPRKDEDEAAFGYRLRRDAAHVDGLLPVGPSRARMLKERHAYILGLPLTEADPEASPLTVWEGSHEVMRAAFTEALAGIAPEDWGEVDLTDCYKAARRAVFETCPRVALPARPGEATLVHRLALHGVAPWQEGADAPPEGRMIAYFRPEFPGVDASWLKAP